MKYKERKRKLNKIWNIIRNSKSSLAQKKSALRRAKKLGFIKVVKELYPRVESLSDEDKQTEGGIFGIYLMDDDGFHKVGYLAGYLFDDVNIRTNPDVSDVYSSSHRNRFDGCSFDYTLEGYKEDEIGV